MSVAAVRRVGVGVALGALSLWVLESCATDTGDGTDGTGSFGGSDGSGGFSNDSGGASNGSGASTSGSTGGSIGSGVGGSGVGGGLGEGGNGPTPDGECGDGVDNDGDGHVDYAFDPGCYGPWDATEAAGSRAEENGFTTFEFGDDSVVVYVSAEGDDGEDGATPETAVRTIGRADELVRDGEHDFMLLRRGDTWRDETLGRFKSGRDAAHPIVIGSYGEALELPRIENVDNFIDHNGEERNNVALLDLHLVAAAMDPTDPEFDGSRDSLLRYTGTGANLLIEGCHLEYVEFVLQTSNGLEPYTGVELRASVIEKAYHADTCEEGNANGSTAYRPSGMFASGVDGVLIEGNVFDHNGWNEEVPSACATIYNHNAYLNGDNIVIRDNVFARSSSIHIKMKADGTGDVTGTRISGNYFVEGEVGVSIGGNNEEPDRFLDSEITNNVFSDIGRSQPTTRTLAWALEVIDNDGLLVEGNHFLNHHAEAVTNSFGVSLADGSARNISVLDNLFYRIQNRGLIAHQAANHEGIEVSGNSFIDPDQGSRLVIQDGTFGGYSYSDNRYFSSATEGAWFSTGNGNCSLETWMSESGETGGQALDSSPEFADPERSIETYAQSLDLGSTLEDYLSEARLQTRLRYRYELSAPAITSYIRAGFEE